jgi:hypothetical protein
MRDRDIIKCLTRISSTIVSFFRADGAFCKVAVNPGICNAGVDTAIDSDVFNTGYFSEISHDRSGAFNRCDSTFG